MEKIELIIKKLSTNIILQFQIDRLIWYFLKKDNSVINNISSISRNISLRIKFRENQMLPVSAAICSQILGEKNHCGCSIVAQQRDDRKKVLLFSTSPGKIVALFIADWNRKLGQDNYVPRKIFFFRPLNYFHPGRPRIIYADVRPRMFPSNASDSKSRISPISSFASSNLINHPRLF